MPSFWELVLFFVLVLAVLLVISGFIWIIVEGILNLWIAVPIIIAAILTIMYASTD